MKKIISLLFAGLVGFSIFAAPTVTDVVAKQRYPWNGLVDITCKVSGVEGKRKFVLSAVIPDSGKSVGFKNFWVVRNGVKTTNYEVGVNGDYRLLWDAKADLGEVCYTNMVVSVTVKNTMMDQLWEGGPYWATMNIGAEKPEDYGYYFWWGDTIGYKRENNKWVASDGSNSNFSFNRNSISTDLDISTLKSEGWTTSDGVLTPEHDAAQIHWGGNWRMPTKQEIDNLNSECDWTISSLNGVNGYVVRGRGEYSSNSIFLPYTGTADNTSNPDVGLSAGYWSSEPHPEYLNGKGASWFIFISSNGPNDSYRNRWNGQSIRPVQDVSLGSEGNAIISGESSPISLDTANLFITASITYNASWIGNNSDATVVITDNGAEIYRGSGEGVLEWNPESYGKHELTYTTYINGIAQDEILSATLYKRAEIKNVVAKQRFPWNGKADINFEVRGNVTKGLPNWDTVELSVRAKDSVTGEEWIAKTFTGDIGIEEGEHHVVWDMKADGLSFYSTNIKFKVSYSRKLGSSKKYCVIDLSAGWNATAYPVAYLADVPEGGWTDEHKTSKLVLRLIEPGSINNIAITEPFYIGIFEVTQKQFELVTGGNPSKMIGETRPVDHISWNEIRGTHNWPAVKTVDSETFIGRMRLRTGFHLDLPTEAQWEYACRAGTTSSYNNGGDSESDLAMLGRYTGSSAVHTAVVGSYIPNAWGLYDMHGNVAEWCLDIGNPSESYGRVYRGGSWQDISSACRSDFRLYAAPVSKKNYYGRDYGFRLTLHLGE